MTARSSIRTRLLIGALRRRSRPRRSAAPGRQHQSVRPHRQSGGSGRAGCRRPGAAGLDRHRRLRSGRSPRSPRPPPSAATWMPPRSPPAPPPPLPSPPCATGSGQGAAGRSRCRRRSLALARRQCADAKHGQRRAHQGRRDANPGAGDPQLADVQRRPRIPTSASTSGGSSWAVLNRVNDPSANPTQILGTIKAPGTVHDHEPQRRDLQRHVARSMSAA